MLAPRFAEDTQPVFHRRCNFPLTSKTESAEISYRVRQSKLMGVLRTAQKLFSFEATLT